jgi:uncharacterized membrane protein YphA (DoxX/SURF4 family)
MNLTEPAIQSWVLLSTRLALTSIFIIAGIAKIADRNGSQQTLVDFGVPRRIAPALAIALPLAELAIALALIPIPLAWFGQSAH